MDTHRDSPRYTHKRDGEDTNLPQVAGYPRYTHEKDGEGTYTMEQTGYRMIQNGTNGFLTRRSTDKLAEYQGGIKLLQTDGRDVYTPDSKRHKQSADKNGAGAPFEGITRERMQSTHNHMLEPIPEGITYRISNSASDDMIELSEGAVIWAKPNQAGRPRVAMRVLSVVYGQECLPNSMGGRRKERQTQWPRSRAHHTAYVTTEEIPARRTSS